MKTQQKAILVNVAILVGLLFEFMRGRTIAVLLITAALLFPVANLALLYGARRQRRSAVEGISSR